MLGGIPGSAFPRFQVGFQTGQEVDPGPACPLINLGEPIMREEQSGAVVDGRELPGNTGSGPLRKALPANPANFLVLFQFGQPQTA